MQGCAAHVPSARQLRKQFRISSCPVIVAMKLRNLLFIIILSLASLAFAQEDYDKEQILLEMDFSDSLTDDYENILRIVDYLSLCENTDNPTACHFESVNQILSLVSENAEKYAFVVKGLLEVYSQTDYDKIVSYIADLPFVPQNIDSSELHPLQQFADGFKKVKIGVQAPEILCEVYENQVFSLYTQKSPFIILAFLSSDCDHCREWLKKTGVFMRRHADYKLIVWNVSGEAGKMKRLLRRYRIKNSVCVTDNQGWRSPVLEIYCVFTTPSVFVLDTDKTIVLKPETVEELYDFAKEKSGK